MKKRKAPVVPIAILIIMVGAALVVNGSMNSQGPATPDNPLAQAGKDEGHATGSEAKSISKGAIKESVAMVLGAPNPNKHGKFLDSPKEELTHPMILTKQTPSPGAKAKSSEPVKPSNDATSGQWYRSGSNAAQQSAKG